MAGLNELGANLRAGIAVFQGEGNLADIPARMRRELPHPQVLIDDVQGVVGTVARYKEVRDTISRLAAARHKVVHTSSDRMRETLQGSIFDDPVDVGIMGYLGGMQGNMEQTVTLFDGNGDRNIAMIDLGLQMALDGLTGLLSLQDGAQESAEGAVHDQQNVVQLLQDYLESRRL